MSEYLPGCGVDYVSWMPSFCKSEVREAVAEALHRKPPPKRDSRDGNWVEYKDPRVRKVAARCGAFIGNDGKASMAKIVSAGIGKVSEFRNVGQKTIEQLCSLMTNSELAEFMSRDGTKSKKK